MMFVSSEVDDQKEEEKEDKLKHHSLFTVFVMCCTFVYKHLLLSPVSQRMFVTAITTADCENKTT